MKTKSKQPTVVTETKPLADDEVRKRDAEGFQRWYVEAVSALGNLANNVTNFDGQFGKNAGLKTDDLHDIERSLKQSLAMLAAINPNRPKMYDPELDLFQ